MPQATGTPPSNGSPQGIVVLCDTIFAGGCMLSTNISTGAASAISPEHVGRLIRCNSGLAAIRVSMALMLQVSLHECIPLNNRSSELLAQLVFHLRPQLGR